MGAFETDGDVNVPDTTITSIDVDENMCIRLDSSIRPAFWMEVFFSKQEMHEVMQSEVRVYDQPIASATVKGRVKMDGEYMKQMYLEATKTKDEVLLYIYSKMCVQFNVCIRLKVAEFSRVFNC